MYMIKCPNCGSDNPADSVFCETCGKRVINDGDYDVGFDPDSMAENGVVCPSCGSALSADSAFCEKCGAPVSGAAAADTGAAVDDYGYGYDDDGYTVGEDDIDIYTDTGGFITADESVDTVDIPGKSKSDKILCPECGAEIDADSVFCESCCARIVPQENADAPLGTPFAETPPAGSVHGTESTGLRIKVGKSAASDGVPHQNSRFKTLKGFDK